MSRIELEIANQVMSDAKEFSTANNGLENLIDFGRPCVNAPCNPAPRPQPPKCGVPPRTEGE